MRLFTNPSRLLHPNDTFSGYTEVVPREYGFPAGFPGPPSSLFSLFLLFFLLNAPASPAVVRLVKRAGLKAGSFRCAFFLRILPFFPGKPPCRRPSAGMKAIHSVGCRTVLRSQVVKKSFTFFSQILQWIDITIRYTVDINREGQ